MMYCYKCGKEVEDGTKFCPYCGAQLDTQSQAYDNYQPINQQQTNYPREDDAPSTGFFILSMFLPIVGIILFIVWNKDYPLKAKSCLKGFVTGIVGGFVLTCCAAAAMGGAISSLDNDYYSGSFNAIVQLFFHG